jgi:hypothetical protein
MTDQASPLADWLAPVAWPRRKKFAFTVFDDPDGQSLATHKLVYDFLTDLGLRTTVAVWPLAPWQTPNSGGENCGSPEYLANLQRLQALGFEVAWHNATPHTSLHDDTLRGLNRFKDLFGHDPVSMANHYNGEAIYWGPSRLTGLRRRIYSSVSLGRTENRFFGHVEGHPNFWGDLARQRIRYCRNFVFSDLNTLARCPWMPYADPVRPWIHLWFAASEGAQGPSFMKAIVEQNQDKLEQEGGACILYTHFGHGFVDNGNLNPTFVRLMTRLAKKNGWFVPSGTILEHLRAKRGVCTLDEATRRRLEWRWLGEKFFRGTS